MDRPQIVVEGGLSGVELNVTRLEMDMSRINLAQTMRPNDSIIDQLGVRSLPRLSKEDDQARKRRAFGFGPWLKCITELKDLWAGETLCIVGGGCSLEDSLPELLELIAAGAKVMAVNKTHDRLADLGIIPTFGILSDPKDWVVDYQKPTPGVKYLIASACCDAVFERFKGHPEVYLWHALNDDSDGDVLLEEATRTKKSFFGVTGGSTTTLRGFDIAPLLLGFREVRFFALDSSADAAGQMYRYEKPSLDPVNLQFQLNDPVDDQPLSRVYTTTQPMYHQARQFELILADRREGIRSGKYPPVRVAVHGDGMLPDWCALRGLHADPTRGDKLRATKVSSPLMAFANQFPLQTLRNMADLASLNLFLNSKNTGDL